MSSHNAAQTDIIFKIAAPPFRKGIEGKYRVHDLVPDRPPPGVDILSRARILVTTGFIGASADEIGSMPNLALICCIGTGYENVDLAAAKARGIMVTHGAGTNAAAVADHAVAMLLAIMRNLHRFDAAARQGAWRSSLGTRPTPTGKRAGIIGLGGIGRRIAQRLQGFEMEVSYHSRTIQADVPWRYFPSVRELAAHVDCLLIAAPGGPSTFHMINGEIMEALGPNGFLVNISRGSLVDTAALVRALTADQIAGAALDVFETEPTIPEELRSLENVLLTPHIASFAPEVQTAGAALLLRNIDAFVADGVVVTPVPEMKPQAG